MCVLLPSYRGEVQGVVRIVLSRRSESHTALSCDIMGAFDCFNLSRGMNSSGSSLALYADVPLCSAYITGHAVLKHVLRLVDNDVAHVWVFLMHLIQLKLGQLEDVAEGDGANGCGAARLKKQPNLPEVRPLLQHLHQLAVLVHHSRAPLGNDEHGRLALAPLDDDVGGRVQLRLQTAEHRRQKQVGATLEERDGLNHVAKDVAHHPGLEGRRHVPQNGLLVAHGALSGANFEVVGDVLLERGREVAVLAVGPGRINFRAHVGLLRPKLGQDRRQLTCYGGHGGHAGVHDAERVRLLGVRHGNNVPVPHGGDGAEGPVHAGQVEGAHRHVVRVFFEVALQPGVASLVVVENGDEVESARHVVR
mmetsp:Transcript_21169/g.40298  ORF Transcript_21169/g.40298 Transcript_21169/m.40298 type:complete len:363 (+) Transcript_21169:476-1564(+)